jgi:hypothetical protein
VLGQKTGIEEFDTDEVLANAAKDSLVQATTQMKMLPGM